MRTILGLLVLLAAPGAAHAADTHHFAWGSFGYVGSNILGTDVDIRIEQVNNSWQLVRTEHRLRPGSKSGATVDVVTYADGRTCPAIAARLDLLRGLSMPAIDLPRPIRGGEGAPIHMLMDGSTTYLEAPAIFGADGVVGSKVRLENYGDGALTAWEGETMTAVQGCWSAQAPKF